MVTSADVVRPVGISISRRAAKRFRFPMILVPWLEAQMPHVDPDFLVNRDIAPSSVLTDTTPTVHNPLAKSNMPSSWVSTGRRVRLLSSLIRPRISPKCDSRHALFPIYASSRRIPGTSPLEADKNLVTNFGLKCLHNLILLISETRFEAPSVLHSRTKVKAF